MYKNQNRKYKKIIVFVPLFVAAIFLQIVIYPSIEKSTPINVPLLSYPQIEYTKVIKESNDFKILFVGDVMLSRTIGTSILSGSDPSDYSAGSAFFDKELIKKSLEEARSKSDIVIVYPHWGIEYSLNNSERQAEYGRFFIDNGADIVIGAHAHVLQNSEEYNGKQIYYSLGNFVFDNMCSIPNACNAGMVEL